MQQQQQQQQQQNNDHARGEDVGFRLVEDLQSTGINVKESFPISSCLP
jgi:hypothetical protein